MQGKKGCHVRIYIKLIMSNDNVYIRKLNSCEYTEVKETKKHIKHTPSTHTFAHTTHYTHHKMSQKSSG
jgi:hypothetical protein